METAANETRGRRSGYGQFCPVAVASEVLAEKWTPLVLRELLCGSERFNDIHRGVPLMSASLLSQRLRNLEYWGILVKSKDSGSRGHSYHLTEAGLALKPIINEIGLWGLKYMRTAYAKENLDPPLLLWDMRRRIKPENLPDNRVVIQIDLTDVRRRIRQYWLVKDNQDPSLDLCLENPGFNVDLTISADIESMARIWMGDLSLETALRNQQVVFDGSTKLRKSVHDWIGLHPFATASERYSSTT